jgi:CheY-like chemotaxis protein
MSFDQQPSQFEAPESEHATIVRMRAVHLVLLTSEWSYRIVMSMLLTRRGYTVVAGGLGEARQLLLRERPDVVLLDAGELPAQLEHTLTLARKLAESASVVVVAGRASAPSRGIPVLARWAPLGELLIVLERAKRQRHFDR